MVQREQTHPVIGQIIAQADRFSAVDAMQDEYERARLSRVIQNTLADYDALMVPTAPTIYRIAEVETDPLVKTATWALIPILSILPIFRLWRYQIAFVLMVCQRA